MMRSPVDACRRMIGPMCRSDEEGMRAVLIDDARY